ncbi:unnamed protein product [Brugia timori]|uniref:Uncharacterized protein n=1 Tax=Brugia timori TaxID=42155 RepID=A0A0R3QA57_9BILA|nr:unnamed protein product [Brugia timori]
MTRSLNVENNFDKMNSTDPLSVGGNIQGTQDDTPRKVDTFMQVNDTFFHSSNRISANEYGNKHKCNE